jgi:cytidylate kinase
MAIITISRGTFSGGKKIAEDLAARVGYPCASLEIIFDAAHKEFGIPEAELKAPFLKRPSFWKQSPGRRIAMHNILRAALLKLSKSGNLVYYGFAGHLLLGGVSHVLRVRIIAGMEYRVAAAMKLCAVTREQAVSMIRNDDKQSIYWARFLYGVDWQDPSLYDVILNLQRVSINGAVETLIQMTGMEEFKPTEASLQAFEDLLLSSMVWAELSKNPWTRLANIRVDAKKGHVTITGDAGSDQIVKAISNMAMHVDGVKELTCDVGVGSNWLW